MQAKTAVVDGARIAYYESGSVHAPAVVLLHGLLSDSETWAADLAPMAACGLRAVAVDLLGHGASDKPDGRYLLDDFAAFLAGFLDALGLRSAVVCGHSLGGAIAVHFAHHYPGRVDRLILVAAGGLGREVNLALRMLALPGAERLTTLVMDRRWVRRLLRWPRMHRLAGVGPERLPLLRRIGRSLFYADARRAFFRSLRGVIGPRGQLGSFVEMQYLAGDLPTLLVWSRADRIIPVVHAHRTHDHLPGSEIVVFETGAHEPHRHNAELFASTVAEFVLR